MLTGIILDSNTTEKQRLESFLRDITAKRTEERLELHMFDRPEDFSGEMRFPIVDFAVADVTGDSGLDAVRRIHSSYPNAEILVIADVTISPMKYLHPSIHASALLIRPELQGFDSVLTDFFDQFAGVENSEENILWIENRDGTFRVPYAEIIFVEAREKKVFVRTGNAEYGITGTLDKLSETLPKYFQRCHRSYVVNEQHLRRVSMKENLLYLRDNISVPLSRSYKDAFRRAAK